MAMARMVMAIAMVRNHNTQHITLVSWEMSSRNVHFFVFIRLLTTKIQPKIFSRKKITFMLPFNYFFCMLMLNIRIHTWIWFFKKMLFTWHASANKHGGLVINWLRMSCVHKTKFRCMYDLDMSRIFGIYWSKLQHFAFSSPKPSNTKHERCPCYSMKICDISDLLRMNIPLVHIQFPQCIWDTEVRHGCAPYPGHAFNQHLIRGNHSK